MNIKKIATFLFSLIFIILLIFGINTKSNVFLTTSQNFVTANDELDEEELTIKEPRRGSVNYLSTIYLDDLYHGKQVTDDGITIVPNDVISYEYYSFYKDHLYTTSIPTSFSITWDKTWNEIYSITYDAIVPHDFIKLREYFSAFSQEQIVNELAPIIEIESLNLEQKLTFEELSNYTVILTMSETVSISNFKDEFFQTNIGDIYLNIVDVKNKQIVNSISLSNLVKTPIIEKTGIEISLDKQNNFYLNNNISKNKAIEISLNFNDFINEEVKNDYGLIYKISIQGSRPYASPFSEVVEITDYVENLFNGDSNLKLRTYYYVGSMEANFNLLADPYDVTLQILNPDKSRYSDTRNIFSDMSPTYELLDTNIDVWFQLTQGARVLEIPIYLTDVAFGKKKDDILEVVHVASSSGYADNINKKWIKLYPDPGPENFNPNPNGDWTWIDETNWYSVPIVYRNDGHEIVSSKDYSNKHYSLLSLIRYQGVISNLSPYGVCSLDGLPSCSVADAEALHPQTTDQMEWNLAFNSSTGAPIGVDEYMSDTRQTRPVHAEILTAEDQLIIDDTLQVYSPRFKWTPVPIENTDEVIQAEFQDYMVACAANPVDYSLPLCGPITVTEIEDLVLEMAKDDKIEFSGKYVVTEGVVDTTVLNDFNSPPWETELFNSVKDNIVVDVIDMRTGESIPPNTTIDFGESIDSWFVKFYIDSTTDNNDYFPYDQKIETIFDLGHIQNNGKQNFSVLEVDKARGNACVQKMFDENLNSGTWNSGTTIGEIKTQTLDHCSGPDGFNFPPQLYHVDKTIDRNLLYLDFYDGLEISTPLSDDHQIGELEPDSIKNFMYKFSLDTSASPDYYYFEDIIGSVTILSIRTFSESGPKVWLILLAFINLITAGVLIGYFTNKQRKAKERFYY